MGAFELDCLPRCTHSRFEISTAQFDFTSTGRENGGVDTTVAHLMLSAGGDMNVNHATEGDISSWLEIVREVEPLFGPMPDFEVRLLRKMGEKAAFCVRSDCQDDRARVRGGIILGGTPAHGWIRWLAVRSFSRHRDRSLSGQRRD